MRPTRKRMRRRTENSNRRPSEQGRWPQSGPCEGTAYVSSSSPSGFRDTDAVPIEGRLGRENHQVAGIASQEENLGVDQVAGVEHVARVVKQVRRGLVGDRLHYVGFARGALESGARG